jgi:CRISPR-associated protein Csb3
MSEASIPVDLHNPGQVFACIGLVEAAEVLIGEVEAAFDWSDASDVRFRLRTQGDESPVARVLSFLSRATASGEAPEGSLNHGSWKSAWGQLLSTTAGRGYPFPDPESPATVVCVLSAADVRLTIEHWGDKTTRDNVKFWAGAGGYPGVTLARDALGLLQEHLANAVDDPFSVAFPQSSSFRLDWRRDYIPIDTGFSLNSHDHIETVGFPLVELLGAIGLNYARPLRISRNDKLQYAYGVAGRAEATSSLWLPSSLLRAALGDAKLPFPRRRFRMFLDWPGKKDQARSITTVTEENPNE